MPKGLFATGYKPSKYKLPKYKAPKIRLGLGKASSRERVPADKKKDVRRRAKNTCEYRGCKHKANLQFHHKNMRNSDNRVSNLELLCPNHHAVRHSEKRRKVVSKNLLGEKRTRLVKKPKKKKTKKRRKKKRKKLVGLFDFSPI